MKFYYQTYVEYHHPGTKLNSGCGGCGETIEQAREVLLHDLAYYQGLEAEFGAEYKVQVTGATIERVCHRCNGTGYISKPMKRVYGRTMKCPDCKAKPEGQPIIVESWINLPAELRV